MTIVKIHPAKGFAIIPNSTLQDSRLSLKALGLLCRLLSYPENWEISIESLANQYKEGKDAIQSAIHELIDFGYAFRQQLREEGNGKFGKWEYHIYSEPQSFPPDEPTTENPTTENPTTENPTTENPHLYKEYIDKEISNKEINNICGFEKFLEIWQENRAEIWVNHRDLDQTKIKLIKRLIQEKGDSAPEIFEKALKYAKNQTYWTSFRASMENILRHATELSDRYLETPGGHVVSDSDVKKAARIKERNDLATRLKAKHGEANNA